MLRPHHQAIVILSSLAINLNPVVALPNVHATHNPSSPSCAKFNIPVTLAGAQNFIFNDTVRVDSDIDAVSWAWDLDTWSHSSVRQRVGATGQVNATFNIAAQLCVPGKGSRSGQTLQIATHGGGFDSEYWDSRFQPETYSYVRAAVKAGYSILTYDRLGVGGSDKPDAYSIVQTNIHADILKEITLLARSGKLTEVAGSQLGSETIPTFTKVVHVGHSLGSVTTYYMLTKYPDVSDGAIMTAFIFANQTGGGSQSIPGWRFAPILDPQRFGDRGSGYMAMGAKDRLQTLFFSSNGGYFDPKALDYAFNIKETITTGDLLSTNLIGGTPAPRYTGPILFFLAEFDLGICDGDCKNAYNLQKIKEGIWPSASVVEAYIQPGVGHGLTLHTNATAGYQVMFNWFTSNGLNDADE